MLTIQFKLTIKAVMVFKHEQRSPHLQAWHFCVAWTGLLSFILLPVFLSQHLCSHGSNYDQSQSLFFPGEPVLFLALGLNQIHF